MRTILRLQLTEDKKTQQVTEVFSTTISKGIIQLLIPSVIDRIARKQRSLR